MHYVNEILLSGSRRSSGEGGAGESDQVAARAGASKLCKASSDNRQHQWATYPLCSIAKAYPSPSPDLPPVADVFVTGSPCSSGLSEENKDELVRLTPTVHFVLDLYLPDEGRRTDDKYAAWFPASSGYSTKQYSCLFANGQSVAVNRSSNHDEHLWPREGDCSKAARFRSVVLTCKIPTDFASHLLNSVLDFDESKAKDNDERSAIAKLFQVQMVRTVSEDHTAKHVPMAFSCPFYKPSSLVQAKLKPLPVIKVQAASQGGYGQAMSLGMCSMVSNACGLREWLEYSKFIGISNAYIYDNSKTEEEGARISEVVNTWNSKNGEGRFTRLVRWKSAEREQWWISQSHAMNSCIRRFSSFHQWIVVTDHDERMVPLVLPKEPKRFQSIMAYFMDQIPAQDQVKMKSSLLVSNWDMAGEGPISSEAKCGQDSKKLLLELGNMQCKSGPTQDRMKSIMNTNWLVNQIIDQGHCTAVGTSPLVLDPETQMRMNHYFSNTKSSCSEWEKASESLLTSQTQLFDYLRSNLRPKD